MEWNVSFFLTSLLLGVALAMDAFSVSVADAFNDHSLSRKKGLLIAGTFAFFQALMPMIGWLAVHFLYTQFVAFRHAVPWIALVLLSFIGIKMIVEYKQESKKEDSSQEENNQQTIKHGFYVTLLIQGVATSIDALSVGLDTAKYNVYQALVCSLIIAVVTFVICVIGLYLGKKFGNKIGQKSILIGGIILIVIGIYICVTGEIKLYVPEQYIPSWLKFLF